jgi:stringent starvation protein B
MLYGTTPDFLRAFGLSSIDALPQTAEEIRAMFARMDGIGDVIESENEQITLSDEDLEVAETTEVANDEEPPQASIETSYENEASAEDDIVED